MRRKLVLLTLALLLLAAGSANATFECYFYSGCRPVHYPGYGYVCTCDSLTQNCTECCHVEEGYCCVNGVCN